MASRKIGDLAEELFTHLCAYRGWRCYEASEERNIRGHWDVLIARQISEGEIEHHKVDVKAPKKFGRYDTAIAYDWVCVEFKNVRGREGWLYGEADLIAFLTKGYFLLVRREDLLTLSLELTKYGTSEAEYVKRSYDAKYNLYTRKKRKDVISWIKTRDLFPVLWDQWNLWEDLSMAMKYGELIRQMHLTK